MVRSHGWDVVVVACTHVHVLAAHHGRAAVDSPMEAGVDRLGRGVMAVPMPVPIPVPVPVPMVVVVVVVDVVVVVVEVVVARVVVVRTCAGMVAVHWVWRVGELTCRAGWSG